MCKIKVYLFLNLFSQFLHAIPGATDGERIDEDVLDLLLLVLVLLGLLLDLLQFAL